MNSSKKATWTALGLAATLIGGSAAAADKNGLGGNCCSDLEERIAELEATAAKKGTRKVNLTVFGQVSKSLLYADFGDESDDDETRVIDNSLDGTRFGFKGDAKINPGLSAGYLIEVGVDENNGTSSDDGAFNVRHSYVYLDGTVGKLSLGHTSQATDGIAEISLGNTDVAAQMLSLEPLSGVYFGGADLPFDGSRTQVVRYDTPAMSGFMGSAAWASEYEWDAALKYAGEFNGVRFAAGVGYRSVESPLWWADETSTFAGSASVQHLASGVFVSAAYGSIESDGASGSYSADNTATGWHLQGGVEQRVTALGKTTFYGEVAEIESETRDRYDGETYYREDTDLSLLGFGVVQNIEAAATDLYLAYRKYELEETSAYGWDGEETWRSEASFSTVMAGARIRF